MGRPTNRTNDRASAIQHPKRTEAIARLKAGEKPGALAREYGISPNIVYYWQRLAKEVRGPILYQTTKGVPARSGELHVEEHPGITGAGGNGFNSYIGWWYPHRNYKGDTDRESFVKPFGKG